jgi:hypothetical protein
MSEQIETSSKKGRGRARKSLDLIEAMFEIAHEAHPITGRGRRLPWLVGLRSMTT